MTDRDELVYITRGTRGETVGGKPRPERVYITGPHFSQGRGPYHEGAMFSSTEDREKASTYPRWVAEGMIARKHWQLPEIEKAN